jgi:hypothetical protein
MTPAINLTATESTRDRRKRIYVPDDPLLSPKEAAAERGQGLSGFWRAVRVGSVPAAIYVSPKCPRWPRSVVRRTAA